MASGSTPDDEIFLIAVTVELDPETVAQLRAVFPKVALEDSIVALIEHHMAEAEKMIRRDRS